MHAGLTPSPWVLRWAHLLPPGCSVLDLACGSGRHARWLAARGHAVTAVDRDASALSALRNIAEVIEADLESDPWPIAARQFGAVLVTNYLWRPLWPQLLEALAPGGVLLYETFATGNESVGRPSRPDFLLQRGELLERCKPLRIVAYQDGFLHEPERFVQRIVAVRVDSTTVEPQRFSLAGPG